MPGARPQRFRLTPVEIEPEMKKTVTRMADGRELIYFDESDDALHDLADQRDLPEPPPASSLRYDPLMDEWVAIAAHRQTRTFLPPAGECPLCPSTPERLTEIPSDYDVVVFENRFPSFSDREPEVDETVLPPIYAPRPAGVIKQRQLHGDELRPAGEHTVRVNTPGLEHSPLYLLHRISRSGRRDCRKGDDQQHRSQRCLSNPFHAASLHRCQTVKISAPSCRAIRADRVSRSTPDAGERRTGDAMRR
jgi:hypothetical protein